MANTPHSSWNLSNIRYPRSLFSSAVSKMLRSDSIRARMSSDPRLRMAIPSFIVTPPRAPHQDRRAPRLLEVHAHRRARRHQAHDSHHRRRPDAFAQRFVIQADVATRDRRLEELARVGDALDRLHQLRHDLRTLGIAE